MTQNESSATNTEPQKQKKSTKPDLFFIRTIICILIFSFVMFVKYNNRVMFSECQLWYKENLCKNEISLNDIKVFSKNLMARCEHKFKDIYSSANGLNILKN